MTGSGVMTTFVCKRIDQKSGSQKYSRLRFAQYLETGARKGNQI